MSEIKVPSWLEAMANDRKNSDEWPNGNYPVLAFRTLELLDGGDIGNDASVGLLQLVIDKAELQNGMMSDLINAPHDSPEWHVAMNVMSEHVGWEFASANFSTDFDDDED